MEVFKEEHLLNGIASENNVHPNMLTRWKTEAANNLHVLFENENTKMRKQAKQYEAQIEALYTQIGKLTARYEWMKKNLESNFRRKERIFMVDFNDSVFSVSAQAEMLGLNRTSVCAIKHPARFIMKGSSILPKKILLGDNQCIKNIHSTPRCGKPLTH